MKSKFEIFKHLNIKNSLKIVLQSGILLRGKNFKLKIPILSYRILILLEILLLLYFLYWRYKLGLVRYFDVDEFAHLHWGYSLFAGEFPYRDFFYLFPPFFLYPIAGIISIFGRTATSVIQARVFIFAVFCLTTIVLILIGKKMKNLETGLLAALILAIIPIPSDKMLEIRPDLVAVVLSLIGIYTFILGMEKKKNIYLFISGLSFFTGLGFVPKTVFYLLPVGVVWSYFIARDLSRGPLAKARSPLIRSLIRFLLGALIPILLLVFLLFSYGKPQFAIFSMTKVANSITATLGHKFYMRPDIFFYPNDTYYGLYGYSQPYWLNLAIYIIASLWAIHRFLSFKNMREFLVAGAFFANLYAFVYIFPLKHAQYLIMIAPFIAYYFADFVNVIPAKTGIHGFRVKHGMTVLLLIYLAYVGDTMYKQKIKWGNRSVLDKLNKILNALPAKTPIFDLTGETIFFPNGYYFCCLPYGQYEESLLFNLPDMESEFNKRGTQAVHAGGQERLNVLPNLQRKFIEEKFRPSDIDQSLWIRR